MSECRGEDQPSEFALRLRAIAEFRNVLVHGYLDVDLNVIELILAERLVDFEEFVATVDAYVRSNS